MKKLTAALVSINESGGEIKGSPEELLEQSSILAEHFDVEFSESIPSCFYEFSLRYNKSDGQIFTGFVAASSANNI